MRKVSEAVWEKVYNKYCFNLARHLTLIDQYLHQALSDRLEQSGYTGIKKQYIQVMPYLGKEGATSTELARIHRMPKPTMIKLVNDVVALGFVVKKNDPNDSRAKILCLTDRGLSFIVDASRIAQEILKIFPEFLGQSVYEEFSACVDRTAQALNLSSPPISQHPKMKRRYDKAKLQIQLNQIHRYLEYTIAEQNAAAGFSNSSRIVLSNIENEGSRIADIAKVEGITKQSIGELVTSTVKAGYIKKIPDPDDGRSQRLVFTALGKQIIVQSMETLNDIERQLDSAIGRETLDNFLTNSARIWQCLGGPGPKSKSGGVASASVEKFLDDWVKVLYTMLVNQQDVPMQEVFASNKHGFAFKPEVLQYLANLEDIKAFARDEKVMRRIIDDLNPGGL